MSDPKIEYHLDADLFRDALRFTAAESGFSERLIEKDYYCSVLLVDLSTASNIEMVFKGGTCLSKIHANFYRLSEDLDFAISTPSDYTRSQRGRRLEPFKRHFRGIAQRQNCFRITRPLRGFNNSTQYGAEIAYNSAVTGQAEPIKVEISVREPIIEPYAKYLANTVLVDPFRMSTSVAPFEVLALTAREAYAEKLRAALCRREPAIRDFFDLDFAIESQAVDATDHAIIELLKHKLSIPENEPIDTSQDKLARLRTQVETQLRPVLRDKDFARFDIDRAFQIVAEIARRCDE